MKIETNGKWESGGTFHDIFIPNDVFCLSTKVEERKGYFSCLSHRAGTGQYPSEELLVHVSIQSTQTAFHLLDKNELMQIAQAFYWCIKILSAKHQEVKRRCFCAMVSK